MFGNFMYGPRGYNSAGFGISAMKRILNGEFKSLHSLRLWYDASEGFDDGSAPTTHVILDLFRLLVITNVQIDRSEQLFFDPSNAGGAPLYKWIKATISFKTACPVPGAIWAPPEKPIRKTNASLHNFYGPMIAPNLANYSNPITAEGIAENSTPSGKDMRRLLGG